MTHNLLIFGTTPYSILLADAFIFEQNRVTSGFVVDSAYIKSATFDLKPVYAFENILKFSPPETHSIIFPLGWKGMNLFRATKIDQAKL